MIRYVIAKLFKSNEAVAFIVASAAGFLLSYLSPYANGKFLDFLLANNDINNTVAFALLTASIGIFSSLFLYYSGTLSVRVMSQVSYSILRDVILGYERTALPQLNQNDPAYTTQHTISDSNAIASFLLSNIVNIPLSLIAAPLIVFIMWSINPIFSVLSVALLILYCITAALLRDLLYKVSLERKKADSTFYSAISSQLNQVLETKLSSGYTRSERGLDAEYALYLPKILRAGKISYSLASIDGIFSALFQSVILIISGIQIINGNMSIGEYTIASAYFSTMLKTAKNLMTLFHTYQGARGSWDRVRQPLQTNELFSSKEARGSTLDTIDSIDICNLSIMPLDIGDRQDDGCPYPKLSFSRPGTYCITGKNGSGKTTLLLYLLGLYESSHKVRYNGRYIEEYDLDSILGKLISTCPQNLYAPDCSVDSLLSALGTPFRELCNSTSIIPLLTARTEGLLHKACNVLSGGELRSIYIWSTIARQTPVLVLDEPTVGLDAPACDELISLIEHNSEQRMIIVVSHDDAVIKASKTVIDFADFTKAKTPSTTS